MSILISPSNNTGWGLRAPSKMFGGARKRSEQHPVRVRGHYRAPWGAHKRGRTGRTTVDDVIDSVVEQARHYTPGAPTPPAVSTVDQAINSVVQGARRYANLKSRRRRVARRHRRRPRAAAAARLAKALLKRARRTGHRAAMRAARRAAAAASAATPRTRRRAAAAAAAAISNLASTRRGNIYWVRDSVTGTRVPVRFRPPRN